MKKENAEVFVQWVQKNLGRINEVIKENLGVETEFLVSVARPSHTTEVFVKLVEGGRDTTRQLTATPLLAQLFKRGSLYIPCGYDSESKEGWFSVKIAYDHNYNAGSNGHDLMDFYVNLETDEWLIEK